MRKRILGTMIAALLGSGEAPAQPLPPRSSLEAAPVSPRTATFGSHALWLFRTEVLLPQEDGPTVPTWDGSSPTAHGTAEPEQTTNTKWALDKAPWARTNRPGSTGSLKLMPKLLILTGATQAEGNPLPAPAQQRETSAAPPAQNVEDTLAPPTAWHGPGAPAPVLEYMPPPDPCVWFNADYLLWWIKDSSLPVPLVTTGTTGNPGIIGFPGTRVVLGQENIDNGARDGGRFTLGLWLDHQHDFGLEGSYFFLANQSVQQGTASSGLTGSPILVIPYFDATVPGDSGTFLADPGRFGGSAELSIATRLTGAEANLFYDLASSFGIKLHLLNGFRFLSLSEELSFSTSSPDLPPGVITVFRTADEFDALNEFYGWQLGVRSEWACRQWYLNTQAKLGLGCVREVVHISGSFTTNDPAAAVPISLGGYFAQPTNIGRFHRQRFALVPEFSLNVGYELAHWLRLSLGYTFLYINEVVRPGDVIDPGINPTQSPAISGPAASVATFRGAPRPTFGFHETDFWAQGLNFGVEFRY